MLCGFKNFGGGLFVGVLVGVGLVVCLLRVDILFELFKLFVCLKFGGGGIVIKSINFVLWIDGPAVAGTTYARTIQNEIVYMLMVCFKGMVVVGVYFKVIKWYDDGGIRLIVNDILFYVFWLFFDLCGGLVVL